MKTSPVTSAVLGLAATAALSNAAALRRAKTSAELCAGTVRNEGGNYFCQAVDQITYSHFSNAAGQYQQVVKMDQDTGDCQFQPKQFSGSLAPFDEPVSLHFRGPIRLKQVAVYMPKGASKREEAETELVEAPQVSAKPLAILDTEDKEKRDHPVVWVTATINGQVVSWINDYFGPAEATKAPEAAVPQPKPPVQSQANAPAQPTVQATATPSPAAGASSSTNSDSQQGTGGDFVRVGYYNAAQQKSQGLTFMGNYGGQGSGAWSKKFGASLSYVNADGTRGASQSTILADTLVSSGHEFTILSDNTCDSSCGYVQPGAVAYKGFGGADKTFLFEFSMPHEAGATGRQADMPALWMLNARIPYTAQYNNCSCWDTGCGEFDIFEVLAPGDDKCKSTLHAAVGGGDSNYFPRPADATIKAAVVFDSSTQSVSVKVIDSSTDFGAGLSNKQVASLRADYAIASGLGSSLFQLG